MKRCFDKLWIVAFAVTLGLVEPALGFVGIEARRAPGTPAIVNIGDPVNIEIRAISDFIVPEAMGNLRVVFTWNNTALRLDGAVANNPGGEWTALGFGSDCVSAAINDPCGGSVPFNDGNAFYNAVSLGVPNPLAGVGPDGTLIATLQFTAIETVAAADVTVVPDITVVVPPDVFVTDTFVLSPTNANITGALTGPALVDIVCIGAVGECDDGNDCTADACVAQACTHTDIGDGQACGNQIPSDCDLPDTCLGAVCQPNFVSVGATCGDMTQNACNNMDTCDGQGVCLDNFRPPGTFCGDPAQDECNNQDTCDGLGICLDNFVASGAACGNPANTDCNAADSCNGLGGCDANIAAMGATCGDPTNNACTAPDTCNSTGLCLSNTLFSCALPTICFDDMGVAVCVPCIPGDATPCDDFNECTTHFCAGILPTTFCVTSDVTDGTPCTSDGVLCNGSEVCGTGQCISPGNPCNDFAFCTGQEICQESPFMCLPGPDPCPAANDLCDEDTNACVDCIIDEDCDDTNDCTLDTCDPVLQTCTNNPIPLNGLRCNDGDPCTFGDVCSGAVCIPGIPQPPGTGEVDLLWVPTSSTVMIGDPVVLELRATAAIVGVHEIFSASVILEWDPNLLTFLNIINNTAPDYEWALSDLPFNNPLNATTADGDLLWDGLGQLGTPLIVDSVLPSVRVLTFAFSTTNLTPGTLVIPAPCAEANNGQGFITRLDGGAAGFLQGNLATTTVAIVECFTAADCDDTLFCTGVESCVGGVCVSSGNPCEQTCAAAPSDPECTDVTCVELGQTCPCTALDGPNDQDGLFCTGIDVCVTGTFVPGQTEDCFDNNECTADICNEGAGICENPPIIGSCNDGDACTLNDMCQGGVCIGVLDPTCTTCSANVDVLGNCPVGETCCDDGAACTTDICNVPNGTCQFLPDAGFDCSDGFFCTGAEVCSPFTPGADPVSGCISLAAPCPGQCDEINGCPITCMSPITVLDSARYIVLDPASVMASGPFAIHLTYCNGVNAVQKYVGPLGVPDFAILPFDENDDGIDDGLVASLVDDPANAVYRTAAEWGAALYIISENIVPDTDYDVRADCGPPGLPDLTEPPTAVVTLPFGDVNGDLVANFADIFLGVRGFQGDFLDAVIPEADMHPCIPNRVVNFADIFSAVLAFQGGLYDSTSCPLPCGP